MSRNNKAYSHVSRQKQLIQVIERTQTQLRQGVNDHYLSSGDLYVRAIQPVLHWFESGIRNRAVYEVPNSPISDWYIFRCAIITYCRHLLKRYRTRWYRYLHIYDYARRQLYLTNLEHVIFALENHYIYGVEK